MSDEIRLPITFPHCPKCYTRDPYPTYRWGGSNECHRYHTGTWADEHFDLRCRRCDYTWPVKR